MDATLELTKENADPRTFPLAERLEKACEEPPESAHRRTGVALRRPTWDGSIVRAVLGVAAILEAVIVGGLWE